MPSSTVTTKGQVTIPKEVRDALGIRPGDRVSFVVRDDIVELRAETVDLRSLYGLLKHTGKPITVAQMHRDVAEAAAESLARSGASPKTKSPASSRRR